MLLAFLTFLAVNAAWLGVTGFALYRLATYLKGNDGATNAVVQHVLLPIFAGKPKKVETVIESDQKGELVMKEREVF